MNLSTCLLVVLLALPCVYISEAARKKSIHHHENGDNSNIYKEIEMLKKTIADLSKQVMMQQFFIEERVRTEGYSGVKVVRAAQKRGLKNYDSSTHLSPSAFTIHDHSNYDRTVGLGELSVVLNGIEFRTRHNDYKLVMPSTISGDYHAIEDIPFPEVPPEVSSKPNVAEQVREMREWFRAFQMQDPSLRDYTQYFKPVLCYLEGAWTVDKNIDEPFPSDRHWLEATSWDDLHKKNRFTAYSGVKNRKENIAFLPTTIVSTNMTTGESEYAQWNYRILCSPIGYDIPLQHFHQEDDLTFRVNTGQTVAKTRDTRAARFKLFDASRKDKNQLLDDIFSTIAGKNNPGTNLNYTVFGEDMFDTRYGEANVPLNTGYYHRAYRSSKNGAGGVSYSQFGFNDENLWVAQTTQPRVAPLHTDLCFLITRPDGKPATRCRPGELRFSYAIPLEVVFMTPLLSWNPYNIVVHNDTTSAVKDGRNGGRGSLALDGIDKTRYYQTPAEFFTGNIENSDSADTVRNSIYVLAPDGGVKRVSASGTRIFLPDIEGIGKIRLRYPIAPVHGEGSSVWKELNAAKDSMTEADPGAPSEVMFEMSLTAKDPPGEHTHEFLISYEEFTDLIAGDKIQVTTEEAQEHVHDLVVAYDSKTKSFRYTMCDGKFICTDGHAPEITLETKNIHTELP